MSNLKIKDIAIINLDENYGRLGNFILFLDGFS
jgi:hypothetical protein